MAVPTCVTYASYGSGTNAGNATFNGASQDSRACFSVRYTGTITNGSTAPNAPAVANLQISEDNSTWYTVATQTASLSNSAVLMFDFYRPWPGAYTRVQITGNDTQSVTYAIVGNQITAVG